MDSIKEGYIIDYISGLQVKETPEEVEAVQTFAKILVDDYGYPKEYMRTRPQYRVKYVLQIQKKNILWTLLFLQVQSIQKIRFILLLNVRKKIGRMEEAN